MVLGFFAEILQQIGIESVQERLLGVVEQRLQDAALMADETAAGTTSGDLATDRPAHLQESTS